MLITLNNAKGLVALVKIKKILATLWLCFNTIGTATIR